MLMRQDSGQKESACIPVPQARQMETCVEAKECAMLAATVDTVPHKLCLTLSAVPTAFNAVASVCMRDSLVFS